MIFDPVGVVRSIEFVRYKDLNRSGSIIRVVNVQIVLYRFYFDGAKEISRMQYVLLIYEYFFYCYQEKKYLLLARLLSPTR